MGHWLSKKERTALYRLYDADDALLYIGIAFDPDDRWQQHRHEHKHLAWRHLVTRRSLQWFDTRDEAEAAEIAAIQAERPRHNGTYNYPDVEFDPAWWADRPASWNKVVQIAHLIRCEIASGRWPPGGRIPSLDVIAAAVSSHRGNASKAAGVLRREGLLELRPGEGLFVSRVDLLSDLVRPERLRARRSVRGA